MPSHTGEWKPADTAVRLPRCRAPADRREPWTDVGKPAPARRARARNHDCRQTSRPDRNESRTLIAHLAVEVIGRESNRIAAVSYRSPRKAERRSDIIRPV